MVGSALGKREKVAVGVSGAIIFATVVYWLWQVRDVIATLRMAYGG
jgi:hypothetical protein